MQAEEGVVCACECMLGRMPRKDTSFFLSALAPRDATLYELPSTQAQAQRILFHRWRGGIPNGATQKQSMPAIRNRHEV